jgi:hypothetical protein
MHNCETKEPKVWSNSIIFGKLPQENNHPLCENSPKFGHPDVALERFDVLQRRKHWRYRARRKRRRQVTMPTSQTSKNVNAYIQNVENADFQNVEKNNNVDFQNFQK